MSIQINVTVNGETVSVEDDYSLSRLLQEHGGEDLDHLAVALNGNVIPRGEWSSTSISDGDEVEMVKPIQGGAQHRG